MGLGIWQIGNNGMRNPYRLQEGLRAYARYPLRGHLSTNVEQMEFSDYLNQEGVINMAPGTPNDGTHARKWRYVAQKMGFIYPKVARGHAQDELGPIYEFTPAGEAFLACHSQAAVSDCFLRALFTSSEPALYRKGGFFSPLRYTAAVLLALKDVTGSSRVDQLCFDTCVQTADPTQDPADVARRIAGLARREDEAASRRVFAREYTDSLEYDHKKENFRDYGNTNRRYFTLCGLFDKAGNGLEIAEGKEGLVRAIACGTFVEDEQDEFANQVARCEGVTLPIDDAAKALRCYEDVVRVAKGHYHLLPAVSPAALRHRPAAEINRARFDLEDRMFDAKEDEYARRQPSMAREIDTYLTLIQRDRGGSAVVGDETLTVPQSERPAYLEWIAWRAFLAIDHMTNTAAEARHFAVDSSLLPTGTAGGGDCDVYVECGNLAFVVEVSLTTGSRQESAETESVRRHVSDVVRENPDKHVVGVFIAKTIASDTYSQFGMQRYVFDDDVECEPVILPLRIDQFQKIFDYLFDDGADRSNPREFYRIVRELVWDDERRHFRAWRDHIEAGVNELAA